VRKILLAILVLLAFAVPSSLVLANKVEPVVDKFLKDAKAGNTDDANAALAGVYTLVGDERTKPSRHEFLATVKGCPYTVVLKKNDHFTVPGAETDYLEYKVTWKCKNQEYKADIFITSPKTYVEVADFADSKTYKAWKNPKDRPMQTVRRYELPSPEEAKAQAQRDMNMANDFAQLFIQNPAVAFEKYVGDRSGFILVKRDMAQDVNILEFEEYGLEGAREFNNWVEQNLGKPVSVKCINESDPWCTWKFDRPGNGLFGPLTFRDGKLEYANLFFVRRKGNLPNKGEPMKDANPK
jgi:hypothetical protein